jgi:GH15 family glucan-1,4-alpha-glucosidase
MNIPREANLELGIIGNCTVAALIDTQARIVWCCLPDFDGDPCFCELLTPARGGGVWAFELEGFARAEQFYLQNTCVLITRLYDTHGGSVEITDFAPRFKQHGRIYHPMMLVRQVTPLNGVPHLRMRFEPLGEYGAAQPKLNFGSNHVRFAAEQQALRLTCDLPIAHIEHNLPFVLDKPMHFLLGPDESFGQVVADFVRDALARTRDYWWEWVRYLSIPFEWQDAVIRAAITLKLCQSEATGGIVAAITTSIPESPNSQRNWDYRFCWLRDAAFVVRALNRLGATRSMEEYLRYLFNLTVGDDEMGPVFGIRYQRELHESQAHELLGYRGMGPVRVGNAAWHQRQNDVYGSVILATTQLFFDQRIEARGVEVFALLEKLGSQAVRLANTADSGLWEFRGRALVHTYSAVMCWAAADRLAKIAARLDLPERESYWRTEAHRLHTLICECGFDKQRGHFVAGFGSEHLDASLLLLADVGFIGGTDPRFVATVEAIGRDLKRENYLFRYIAADDFGAPETSFSICTFWYIDALITIGRCEEARALFENMLLRRNALGLLSEDVDPNTGELWGNYPQTYSLVGLIHVATRLSRSWESAF